VIVAVSSITVFGTLLMLLYPALLKWGLLALSNVEYGLWTGASIHEVAQVIAAAFAGGEASGTTGTLVKLTRVAALVPFSLVLTYLVTRQVLRTDGGADGGTVRFPYFLFGFMGMVALNSLEFFTERAVVWIETFDMFLLTMSMAAMGLETDFARLLRIGFRPFFLSIFATAFISVMSLVLVKLLA
jgi:uncharacterized integral membrane protein (TIGR00698 family)